MHDVRGKNGGSRRDGGGPRAAAVPGKSTLVQKRYGAGARVQRKMAEPAGASEQAVTHVVQRGETLGVIARRYLGSASRWQELAEDNGIDDPARLQIGQVLTIRGASTPSGQRAGDSVVSATEEQARAGAQVGQPAAPEPDVTAGARAPAQDVATDQQAAAPVTGANQATPEGSPVEVPDAGPGAGAFTVTDGRALLRRPPPDLSSTAEVVPAGSLVRIVQSAARDGREYVLIEQVLQEGEPGPAVQHGWTSKANLSGFEGGGHTREHDEALRPEDPVLLAGLSGLDRAMAIIYNAKGKYLHEQAQALGITTAAAAAVLKVESRGQGFASDGRMIIRFENHVFYDRWGRSNADKFARHFQFNADERWKGQKFRASETDAWESCHQSQSQEWEVLAFARGLADDAALQSISMGAAQIMGFNYGKQGYASVQAMFDDMSGAITPQLVGMFTYIERTPACIQGLRAGDYVRFATGYNGSGQAARYGAEIANAADAFARVAQGKRYAD
jgi:nucleoid-associated protein YgaU